MQPASSASPDPAAAPSVSVVIASRNTRATIEACLGALARQSCRDFETLVVDSSSDGTAEFVARAFPGVRLLHFSERKYPGAARNIGVAQARGEILAFVDADCVADPDWLSEIVAAHAGAPDLVIGGAVANANPGSVIGWGAYLAEFSQWLPGLPRRRMLDIPTCCLSLKRAAFERFGPFRESGYCSDTAFNWRASAAGQPPLFVPTLQVAHTNLTALPGLLRKLAMHGRAFAQMRLAEQQLPAIRVAVLALAALPVLPALLGARILVRVLRSSVPFARFLLALPVLVAALFAWSWGEATGYAEHLVCVPDTSDRQAGAA